MNSVRPPLKVGRASRHASHFHRQTEFVQVLRARSGLGCARRPRRKNYGSSCKVAPRAGFVWPTIEGEDADTYDELLARILAAVKPVDVIEEMLIADAMSLEWEVLRWRRLKTSLIQSGGLAALEAFLREQLAFALYRDLVAERLTEILQEDDVFQAKDAQTLANQYARNGWNAVEQVENIVDRETLKWILNDARDRKVKDLVPRYARHESDAVTLVDKRLAAVGTSIDNLLANALAMRLDDIERIDRLTAVAEGRRNAALREIDRRRVVLGEILRRSVQELEERERKLLEAPANGEKAA